MLIIRRVLLFVIGHHYVIIVVAHFRPEALLRNVMKGDAKSDVFLFSSFNQKKKN